jgi:hypothetical protein
MRAAVVATDGVVLFPRTGSGLLCLVIDPICPAMVGSGLAQVRPM